MHNGFVTVNNEKMSKSLNNILLVDDLIKETSGEVLRLALLSSHYRQGLDWNDKILHQAKKLLDKLYRTLLELDNIDISNNDMQKPPKEIIDALCDDLNTPQVMSELNVLIKDLTKKSESEKKAIKKSLISTGKILGILEENPNDWFKKGATNSEKVEALIQSRNRAREEKNFDLADSIREELLSIGVEIEDKPSGTTWKTL